MASPAFQRLRKEWQEICRDPPPLCTAGPIGDNFHEWRASVFGSKDTPYEGGIFKILITFPADYPAHAPRLVFETPIYHPNIYGNGLVCLNVLSNWSSSNTITTVLIGLCATLASANPDSPANSEAGTLYKNKRAEFEQRARDWTRAHAQK